MARNLVPNMPPKPDWARLAICVAILCAPLAAGAQERAPRPAEPAARKPTSAAPKPAARPAPKPNPGPTATSAPAGPNFVFLDHARNAGVGTCLPMLRKIGGALIDSEQSAVSIWEKTAPDKNVFSATSYGGYADKIAPRSLATIIATPKAAGRCDGAGVRIQPSSLSCETIAANLKAQNVPEPAMLGDARVYPIANIGVRPILLPTASGDGCVVITQILSYEK